MVFLEQLVVLVFQLLVLQLLELPLLEELRSIFRLEVVLWVK